MSRRPVAPLARRTVLAGGILALAGCGVRLERSAPRIPGIPTQGPPPDGELLLATIDRLNRAATTVGAAASPWGTRLASVHLTQSRKVIEVAASQGVRVPTSAPTLPSTDGATPLAVESEGATPAVVRAIAGAEPAIMPMLLVIAATQAAGSSLLGAPPAADPAPVSGSVANALLTPVRRATYAVEVAIAKTPLAQRTTLRALLTMLYAERSRIEVAAGAKAPAPPTAFSLPVAADTPQRRTQLVQRVLADVVQACGHATGTRDGLGGADGAVGLVRTWGVFLSAAWTAGVAPAAFPGLR
ncbi:hypothetical protein G9U51_00620 [Calidifontibacter sp. DB0510]|uniref:DUF4439 domain-containing protein n=1 Tax=Metallococcus carri TaxID=1656884 RepID=A0A967E7M3_9MICO|nr:hypothetical protein [Metallococcus carri]NHN54287.1 hypothetical protein [Metallococcus carri]NOP36873.1 hypothetical protein [Calidifontibacter sp. DB2511S]